MNIIGQIDPSAFAAAHRLHHMQYEPTIEFPSSVGSRARGLLALKACNWRASGGGGWTNPYITDGLVQQYDGVWNAGGGIHADASTSWKDLVGTNDATLTQYATIAPDCLQIQGQIGYAASYRGDITDEYTIEASLMCKVPSGIHCRITAESPYPSLYLSTNGGPDARFAFYGQNYDGPLSIDGYIDRAVRRHYAVTYNGEYIIGYVDGLAYGTSQRTSITPSSVSTATFGNRLSGERGFNGEYCAFRRYSRALTAEEIHANYLVDADRFGMT